MPRALRAVELSKPEAKITKCAKMKKEGFVSILAQAA